MRQCPRLKHSRFLPRCYSLARFLGKLNNFPSTSDIKVEERYVVKGVGQAWRKTSKQNHGG